MQTQEEAARRTRIFNLSNLCFLILDLVLFALSGILSLIYIKEGCVSLMFLLYAFMYAFQSGQHYLIRLFPKIDINKHNVLYRRLVLLICFSDAGYLFATIIFWQKTQSHPIYCGLCLYYGFGLWIGLVLVFHFLFILGWALTLIQSYIQRRYYLLALGGFQVQQRMIEERQRQLQQMMIRQPDYDAFPMPKKNKYFKFEDVIEQELEQNQQCSICLNKESDEHFVNAGCGHFYHNNCLVEWVKVNSNCPQCRYIIQESKIGQEPKQKVENDQI